MISANGRFVAYVSDASNLISDGIDQLGDGDVDDINGFPDVYRWDRKTKTNTLISVDSSGTRSGNFPSLNPVVNRDGTYVAFESYATNLVTGPDPNGDRDVFLRVPGPAGQYPAPGFTYPVSINRLQTAMGNGPSYSPSISANGMSIAFVSEATDLVVGPLFETDDPQVYLFTLTLGDLVVVPISITPTGQQFGNGDSNSPVISSGGRYVAFQSIASNLVDGVSVADNNATWDVFVRGVFEGLTGLVIVDHTGNETANGSSGPPMISSDATVVAFESEATNLADPGLFEDSNGTSDVFARYMIWQRTMPLSIRADWSGTGNAPSSRPVVSADGRFVAFDSDASDLILRDNNATECT